MPGFRDRADRQVLITLPNRFEITYYTRGRRYYIEPTHAPKVRNPINLRVAAAAAHLIIEADGNDLTEAGQSLLAEEKDTRVMRTDLWIASDILHALGIPLRPQS